MSSQNDLSSFFIIKLCPCNFTFVREGGANAVFAYRGRARGGTTFSCKSCETCETHRCKDPIPSLRRFLKHECGIAIPPFLSGPNTSCTASSAMNNDAAPPVSPFVVRVSKRPIVPLSVPSEEFTSLSEGGTLSLFKVKDKEGHHHYDKEGEGQGAEAHVEEVLRPYLGARVGPLMSSAEGIKITLAAEIVLSNFQSSNSCCCCVHAHNSCSGASEKALLCSFSLLPNYAAPVSSLVQTRSLQEQFSEDQHAQQLPSPRIHVSFELKPKRAWCPPSEAIPAALQTALESVLMEIEKDADKSRYRVYGTGAAVLREDGTEKGETCKESSVITTTATITRKSLFVRQLSQRILQGCYSDGKQYVHPIKARRCRFSQMATYKEIKSRSENKKGNSSTVEVVVGVAGAVDNQSDNTKKKDISKKHRWDLVPTVAKGCFSSASSTHTSTARVLSHCTEAYLSHLRTSLSLSLAAGGETGRDRPSLAFCPSLIFPQERKRCREVSSTTALNEATNVKVKQACPHCEETLVMSCSGDGRLPPRPSAMALGALLTNPRNNLAVLGHSFTEMNSTSCAICSSNASSLEGFGCCCGSSDSSDQSKKQLTESVTYRNKQERLGELLSFVEAVLESDVSGLFTSLSGLQCAGLEIGALGGARDILERSSLLEHSALEGNGDACTCAVEHAELNECGGLGPSETKRFLSALEDRFYTAITASDVSVMLSVEMMHESACSIEKGRSKSGWFGPEESACTSSRGRVTAVCGDWFLAGEPHEGCGFLVKGYRAARLDENSSEFLDIEGTRPSSCPSAIFTMIMAVIDIDCKRTKPISYYANQDDSIVSSCVVGDVR